MANTSGSLLESIPLVGQSVEDTVPPPSSSMVDALPYDADLEISTEANRIIEAAKKNADEIEKQAHDLADQSRLQVEAEIEEMRSLAEEKAKDEINRKIEALTHRNRRLVDAFGNEFRKLATDLVVGSVREIIDRESPEDLIVSTLKTVFRKMAKPLDRTLVIGNEDHQLVANWIETLKAEGLGFVNSVRLDEHVPPGHYYLEGSDGDLGVGPELQFRNLQFLASDFFVGTSGEAKK